MPVQITYRNTELDAAEESRIRASADGLQRFCPYLEATRVTIDTPDWRRRNRGGHLIIIEMRVRGSELWVSCGPDRTEPTNLSTALHNLFRAARLELEAYTRLHRAEQPLEPHSVH